MVKSLLTDTNLNTSFRALTLDFKDKAKQFKTPGAAESADDAFGGFGGLINQILNIVLVIGVIAVLLFLIWGAIEWITAGGDKGKTEKAREKITGGVIGLVVLFSVVAIMIFIQQLLGVCIINFGGSSCGSPSTIYLPLVTAP